MDPYCVILPVKAADVPEYVGSKLVRYFQVREIHVVIVTCGGDYIPAEQRMGIATCSHIHIVNGTQEFNPYPARNAALHYAYHLLEADGFLLLDADVLPEGNFHDELCKIAAVDKLLAGIVKTRISDHLESKHFRHLASQQFECYDGFRPADVCVGANMFIGKHIYEMVGKFTTDRSGGDAAYSVNAKRLGVETTPAPRCAVHKNISTLTLLGMIQKQALRGASDPIGVDPLDHASNWLEAANSLNELGYYAATYAHNSTNEAYARFVDKLMLTLYRLGGLSKEMDT